ncbi:hypothetical protein J3Q64DRAFT_1696435 [Phycomyces blakesleeanus]|uniref:Uncharacterized protein n=2 Tax=Phycomyces blakesleeanus TaxID=4837 RepID=A0A162TQ29_PHYB8|nr:hypothetical protein PHYBLDRAFT_171558 [Phycomyces blakesleeanus NRRL 1555(-)]OAD70172.1 hypothetical protein PHYBLDRAFT_171558 [Phycomyces blakesleeanus NRRL 1555(-)]|eukprot:XP_018288212.1 hypothetical protein PHYBLDRAFT_171558 [Phycomyces blakesleeanus NRRL 1555(-)]
MFVDVHKSYLMNFPEPLVTEKPAIGTICGKLSSINIRKNVQQKLLNITFIILIEISEFLLVVLIREKTKCLLYIMEILKTVVSSGFFSSRNKYGFIKEINHRNCKYLYICSVFWLYLETSSKYIEVQ